MEKFRLIRMVSLLLSSCGLILTSCNNLNNNSNNEILCEDDKQLSTFVETKKENIQANEVASSGLVYAINGTEATVRLGTCTDNVINVPSTYNDGTTTYTVTGVAPSGFSYSDLANTGTYGKYYLPDISTINLPSTILTIGSQAFKDTNITSFSLPKGVTTINPSTFLNCKLLASFDFGYDELNGVRTYNVLSIGDHAFEGDYSLKIISLPNSITSIGEASFRSCRGLPQIIIPNNISSIGAFAFEYCSAAKVIYVPSGIVTWGEYAFKGCTSADKIFLSVGYPASLLNTNNGYIGNATHNYRYNGNYISLVTNIGVMDYMNGFYFTYDDALGECTIYKYDGESNDVVVPTYLGSRKVVAIANNAFENMTRLTSVTIGESINNPKSYLHTIGQSAFKGCTGIKKISLENASSLKYINNSAFRFNSLLDETTGDLFIPASVIKIENDAFSGIYGYTSIVFEDTVLNPSQLTAINASAFKGANQETFNNYTGREFDLVLPSKLRLIGNSAFAWCFNLRSITFTNDYSDDGVNNDTLSLDTFAFSRCFRCIKVNFSTVPNSKTSVGSKVFEYFGGDLYSNNNYSNHETLTSIFVPNNVTFTTSEAFTADTRLIVYREENNASEVTTISPLASPDTTFTNSAPSVPQYWNVSKDIIDSTNITTSTPSLTQRTLVHYTSDTGDFDFLTTPGSLDLTLTRFVFRATTSTKDTNPVVPETVTINGTVYTVRKIGINAFYYSKNTPNPWPSATYSLKTVQLPNTITEIGDFGFAACEILNLVSYLSTSANGALPTSLERIGKYALSWTAIKACTLPESLISFGSDGLIPFGSNSSLKIIVISSTQTDYSAIDNVIYMKKNTNVFDQLIYIPGGMSGAVIVNPNCTSMVDNVGAKNTRLTSLTLSKNIGAISNYAFASCTGITSVSFTNDAATNLNTSIGYSSFYGCNNLVTFEYSPNLTTIDSFAFQNCTKLTGGDLSQYPLTSIGASAYQACSALSTIYLPYTINTIPNKCFYQAGKNAGTLELDLANVATIEESAFQECTTLKTLNLPASVTTLGVNAFRGCNAVTSLNFDKLNGLTSCTTANSTQNISIKNNALRGFYNTSSVVFPKGVRFDGGFNNTNNDQLPLYNSFTSASYDSNTGIFLADTEIEYLGANAANYPMGWNYSSYSASTGASIIPYYFYADSINDIPSTGFITDAHFWHYVNGVPTPYIPQ